MRKGGKERGIKNSRYISSFFQIDVCVCVTTFPPDDFQQLLACFSVILIPYGLQNIFLSIISYKHMFLTRLLFYLPHFQLVLHYCFLV